jgi:dCMP deaminase
MAGEGSKEISLGHDNHYPAYVPHHPTRLDQYLMKVANVVAKRSTCPRNQVGALFVKNKSILSTGYNGAPSGLDHCDVVGYAREDVDSGTRHELCRAVHAEQNAIIQAALHGISIEEATLC